MTERSGQGFVYVVLRIRTANPQFHPSEIVGPYRWTYGAAKRAVEEAVMARWVASPAFSTPMPEWVHYAEGIDRLPLDQFDWWPDTDPGYYEILRVEVTD